jgi:4-hydroxythreonine-4-phosphate dehydrogenase
VKPRALAVSLGDPAGIGPEVTAKAWRALKDTGPAFLVVGDFDSVAAVSGQGASIVRRVGAPDEAARAFSEAIPVLDLPLRARVVAGQPSPSYAHDVIRWIETAVGLALSGAAGGVVTAPIAKAPLYEAGFEFPGHTEFLANLTMTAAQEGPRGPVMMLAAPGLRTVLVTIHEPLSRAATSLTVEKVVNTAIVTHQALRRDFGIAAPRIVMAALNPHAGEGGKLGTEEQTILGPACRALSERGIDCRGPLPADTLFHPEARAKYDAVVCMYHDQALIPVKMLDFWGGVNITLGLPIVRTSPDHGAAFDIAGRGLARADSMIAAIRAAAEIAARRVRP